jgi:hypothetical protein
MLELAAAGDLSEEYGHQKEGPSSIHRRTLSSRFVGPPARNRQWGPDEPNSSFGRRLAAPLPIIGVVTVFGD